MDPSLPTVTEPEQLDLTNLAEIKKDRFGRNLHNNEDLNKTNFMKLTSGKAGAQKTGN